MPRFVVLGVLTAVLAVTGCASAEARNQPAWFREASRTQAHGYPSLRDVPRTTTANTNAAHWAQVESQMEATRQAALADPRSVYTPPPNPDAFTEDARAAIEASRAHHEGTQNSTTPH